MRRTLLAARGAKGYGWYNKFMREGAEGFKKNRPPTPFNWEEGNVVRPRAFLEFASNNEKMGRLVFELADDVVPRTVQNFLALCEDKSEKKKHSYLGTRIHQIYKGTFIMAGDVENNDGSASHSAGPDRYFRDENFIIPHSERGYISMASIGVDTNGSQFYISLKPTAYMNGRCMVFGRLVEGEETLKLLEKAFTFRGLPTSDIIIADAGLIK